VFSEFVGGLEGYEDADPQDFYEVFVAALGPPITAERLRSLSLADYDRLLASTCEWYEVPAFPLEVLESVVVETLRQWPAEN
jgi:hypothetical protein